VRVILDESERTWFDDHVRAAGEIGEFLAADEISLGGQRVADIGCGDGIIDLALTLEHRPQQLVGFDINPVDSDALLAMAQAMDYAQALPPELEFKRSQPEFLPVANSSFDVVVSWSAFEHVGNPRALLTQIARVLTPGGFLMLQLFPFYASEHGSHLWPWFPDGGFIQFTRSDREIEQRLHDDPAAERALGLDKKRGLEMLTLYRDLNRITIAELQRCLIAAGFSVVKFELMTRIVRLPAGRLEQRYPLTDLGIDGIKLLARSESASWKLWSEPAAVVAIQVYCPLPSGTPLPGVRASFCIPHRRCCRPCAERGA
jgi:SAM-dependent methyltransferase